MAGYMNVDVAIEEAKKALASKRQVLKIIDTIRSDLRNAVDRQEVNEGQRKWIGEHFPMRERKRKSKDAKTPTPTVAP